VYQSRNSAYERRIRGENF